jgi:hypothetical protein
LRAKLDWNQISADALLGMLSGEKLMIGGSRRYDGEEGRNHYAFDGLVRCEIG